jgi:hypothetical protein
MNLRLSIGYTTIEIFLGSIPKILEDVSPSGEVLRTNPPVPYVGLKVAIFLI